MPWVVCNYLGCLVQRAVRRLLWHDAHGMLAPHNVDNAEKGLLHRGTVVRDRVPDGAVPRVLVDQMIEGTGHGRPRRHAGHTVVAAHEAARAVLVQHLRLQVVG